MTGKTPPAPAPQRAKATREALPRGVRSGVPDKGWTRQELSRRAVWEYRRVKGRRKDAAEYWPLGQALRFVRRGLKKRRGAWTRWRKARRIDRTRAQRALLFARAFKSPDEIRDMTIAEATDLANERLGVEPRQAEIDASFRRWLLSLTKTARQRLDDLNKVRSPEMLLPFVDELGELFAQFRGACRAPPRNPK